MNKTKKRRGCRSERGQRQQSWMVHHPKTGVYASDRFAGFTLHVELTADVPGNAVEIFLKTEEDDYVIRAGGCLARLHSQPEIEEVLQFFKDRLKSKVFCDLAQQLRLYTQYLPEERAAQEE